MANTTRWSRDIWRATPSSIARRVALYQLVDFVLGFVSIGHEMKQCCLFSDNCVNHAGGFAGKQSNTLSRAFLLLAPTLLKSILLWLPPKVSDIHHDFLQVAEHA